MKKIIIIGAGGFGREVLALIEAINRQIKTYTFIGFIDDGIQKGTPINGYPVLGDLKLLTDWEEEVNIAIAIGNPEIKRNVVFKISQNNNILFPNLIHPNTYFANYGNTIGIGNLICEGSIITTNVTIKNHIILNLACTIGHDTIINSFCSVMPGVNISGEVNIKECVYVGTGAKIINQLEIGENTIVGAGAVVFKSLPSNCTAVGVPAKPIMFHDK